MAQFVDPDALFDVEAWLARLRMEPVVAQRVPADAVFAAMEMARQSGNLSQHVSEGTIRCQASPHQPGALERIAADGTRTTGRFSNGCFIPTAGVPD